MTFTGSTTGTFYIFLKTRVSPFTPFKAMKYIRVYWRQANPNYPTVLYSELDDARWELRKVEVFGDGRYQYASQTASQGCTRLGIEPVPAIEEIAADPQFEPIEITRREFEEIWLKAVTTGNHDQRQ